MSNSVFYSYNLLDNPNLSLFRWGDIACRQGGTAADRFSSFIESCGSRPWAILVMRHQYDDLVNLQNVESTYVP
jgi:hypothetical protein